jgi:hypothetical protein
VHAQFSRASPKANSRDLLVVISSPKVGILGRCGRANPSP